MKHYNETHGLSKHPLYKLHNDIKNRCFIESTTCFKYYGGRGISMCDEWKNDFLSFYNWAIANGYQKGLQIDRKNVNGNYEPSNCIFVTQTVNARNTRANVNITYLCQTRAMSEWALIFLIPYKLLQQRLVRDKLTFEEAITKPIRRWANQKVSTQYTPDKTTRLA